MKPNQILMLCIALGFHFHMQNVEVSTIGLTNFPFIFEAIFCLKLPDSTNMIVNLKESQVSE